MTDRSSSAATSINANDAAKAANMRSTLMIANKMAATNKLKGELSSTSAAVEAELAKLNACMGATQAEIDAKKAPLEAVATYYAKRQGDRPVTERLSDPVKQDLETMSTTLKESTRLLESALSAQQSEVMRLQVRKDALDADVADKAAGIDIDTAAKGVTMLSQRERPFTAPPAAAAPITISRPSLPGGLHRSGMGVLHAPYNPIMWRSSSKAIADEALKVVSVAARLRETSVQLIRKRQAAELEVYTDLVRDYESSIANIKLVVLQTDDQVSACKAEMDAIDAEVAACESAYGDKQNAISVAAERLSLRSTRPMRELVQDPAQRALSNELATLKYAARMIEGSAAKLLADKSKLASIVSVLEDTIKLKSEFLAVEEAGEPTMSTLATLCTGPTMTPVPPAAPFQPSFTRPVTTLPAHRLSLSRVYATR